MEAPITSFYNHCRLCLNTEDLHRIYDIEGLPLEIFHIIGIQVIQCEYVPQKICTQCLYIVKRAGELREQAQKNEDKYLNGIVNWIFEKSDSTEANDNTGTSSDSVVNANTSPVAQRSKFVPDRSMKRTELSENPSNVGCNRRNSEEAYNELEKRIKQEEKENNEAVEYARGFLVSVEINSTEDTDNNATTTPVAQCSKFVPDSAMKGTNLSENPSNVVHSKSEADREESRGDTIYRCKLCSKNFNTIRKLYLHNRLHLKNLKCSFLNCGKKFASKNDLRKHERVHTGEKPYVCDTCGKGFTQNVSLKVHKEKLHVH